MEEKKKFNYSILLFLILIIIIVIMGYFLYKTYNEKSAKEDKNVQLNAEISNLKNEISSINNKENNTFNNVNDNSEDNVNTNFYGVYTSVDKVYKFVFLPNGEMCYINNNSSDYKVMPGTYYIKDNKLYYSTSRMMELFGIGRQDSYFEIVDKNTLEYNNTNYIRVTVKKLNGTYSTDDSKLILDNNGNYELISYGEKNQKGKYVINNNILELNNESEEKNDENFETTYLILDKDTIVAQWEIDGKLYYEEYMNNY